MEKTKAITKAQALGHIIQMHQWRDSGSNICVIRCANCGAQLILEGRNVILLHDELFIPCDYEEYDGEEYDEISARYDHIAATL